MRLRVHSDVVARESLCGVGGVSVPVFPFLFDQPNSPSACGRGEALETLECNPSARFDPHRVAGSSCRPRNDARSKHVRGVGGRRERVEGPRRALVDVVEPDRGLRGGGVVPLLLVWGGDATVMIMMMMMMMSWIGVDWVGAEPGLE